MNRIQRKRTKGWKSPTSTRFCGRGTKYGNHFRVLKKGNNCYVVENTLNNNDHGVIIYKDKQAAVKMACQLHAFFLDRKYPSKKAMKEYLKPLRAFENLSCWCRMDNQCHVDYFISLIKKYWPEESKNA